MSVAVITGRDGADNILEHLDKSYAIDATDQLDIDLATFLDFSWKNHMPVEQFIAGFHSRLDRIASLNMDAKQKRSPTPPPGRIGYAYKKHDRRRVVGESTTYQYFKRPPPGVSQQLEARDNGQPVPRCR